MSKNSRWLSKTEAKFLGLKVKEDSKGSKQNRYPLTEDQYNQVLNIRATPNKRKEFIQKIGE